jgi:hypothetical protein
LSGAGLTPLLILGLGVALDLWIYSDAQRQAALGRPVVFRAGNLVVATPVAWAVACLLVWVVFLPLYVASRRTA